MLRITWAMTKELEEGNSNLLQYSCLENSMDREAWRATVLGVAKSWPRLSSHTHTNMTRGTLLAGVGLGGDSPAGWDFPPCLQGILPQCQGDQGGISPVSQVQALWHTQCVVNNIAHAHDIWQEGPPHTQCRNLAEKILAILVTDLGLQVKTAQSCLTLRSCGL